MKQSLLLALALPLCALSLHAEETPKIVTAEEAAATLKTRKDITVLDLRTPDEFKSGHIAGARNIDFLGDDFAQQIAALDKSKTYLIHCAGGGRSTQAVAEFQKQKIGDVLHLKSGLSAWQKSGQPVEK